MNYFRSYTVRFLGALGALPSLSGAITGIGFSAGALDAQPQAMSRMSRYRMALLSTWLA